MSTPATEGARRTGGGRRGSAAAAPDDAEAQAAGVSLILAHAGDTRIEALGDAARRALLRAKEALGVPATEHVALVLADDATLRRLNHRHRGLDRTTDVLSFRVDPGDLPSDEPRELGDIVISVPYALRSAAAGGHAQEAELRLLAVHGLLHLLGHDDATEAGAADMRRIERQLGVRPAG